MKILLAIFCILFIAISIAGITYISQIQNEPYMDEIFHVPQAKNFCAGNFTHWDPMITTLPGLYLASVGLYRPVAIMLDLPITEICTTLGLRATNVLFAVGNFYLIYAILKKIHNPVLDPDGVRLCMTTLALSTFPLLYFFTFLYYTDPGSIFFVLIMYLFNLHDNHLLAATMGAVSVLFRQTNIVWVIFMLGMAKRKCLSLWIKEDLAKNEKKIDDLTDWELFKFTLTVFLDSIINRQKHFMKLVLSILKNTWPYILVGIGFAIFIFLNQGIVVGDRSNHTSSFNLPQIFYFLSMTNFFAIFHLFSPYKIWEFGKFCIKHPVFVLAFMLVSAIVVHYFTYEHKYLLADNRHYTFYVWSKIYRRHQYVKYALIPAYLYFSWSFGSALIHRDIFWKLTYIICVVLTSVPQKLLEFRYFILPYLIFRINMRYGTAVALLHEILLYILVNLATVYLFTEKPFRWPHEEALQRFMW